MSNLVGPAIILVCFGAGYWLISTLMTPGPKSTVVRPPAPLEPRWFDILGVSQFASRADIERAYNELAATLPPGSFQRVQLDAAYQKALGGLR
jgi:hypothetical protein